MSKNVGDFRKFCGLLAISKNERLRDIAFKTSAKTIFFKFQGFFLNGNDKHSSKWKFKST